MSKKSVILSLSLVGVCALVANSASAQLLAGNVWPNADLTTAAPAGVDQVYSFYNVPPSSPNVTGDSNPRPDGWHRGGVDFGTTTAPQQVLYNPAEGSTLSPPPSGDSLEINDNDANAYGEWFSDWNPVNSGGGPVMVQFYWAYTNLNSTQRPQDNFRVTVNWGDAPSDDITSGDPNNLGHTDYNLFIPGTVDQTAWTAVTDTLTPPAGATSMRITVDSGGSSQATGQLWVSDISVAIVPEPASFGLLASGALLLGRRRRA